MKQHDENGTQSAFSGGQMILTFVAGAAAGAITALLVAPRSGDQTRDRIKQMAGGSKEKLGRVPAALVEAKEAATHAFKEAMGGDSAKGPASDGRPG
jgi:gas vesicle protein